jgi:hypothetical protein
VLQKLGTDNRTQAVILARRLASEIGAGAGGITLPGRMSAS